MFQGAHDFGLIFGSILSAVVISYTVNLKTGGYVYDNTTIVTDVSEKYTLKQ